MLTAEIQLSVFQLQYANLKAHLQLSLLQLQHAD